MRFWDDAATESSSVIRRACAAAGERNYPRRPHGESRIKPIKAEPEAERTRLAAYHAQRCQAGLFDMRLRRSDAAAAPGPPADAPPIPIAGLVGEYCGDVGEY